MSHFHGLKTAEVGDFIVRVVLDEGGDHECPLDFLDKDDGVKFVSFERNSTLSGKKYNEFATPEKAVKFAKANDWEAFPLFKYSHSVDLYSVRSFIGRAQHAEWDSGQIGYVLIKKNVHPADRLEVADGWCKAITTWANGWYYGYIVENDEGDVVDSVWGYDDENYALEEGIQTADAMMKEAV